MEINIYRTTEKYVVVVSNSGGLTVGAVFTDPLGAVNEALKILRTNLVPQMLEGLGGRVQITLS